MGFFSFRTGDTDQSISNKYTVRGALPVEMVMPDGTRYAESDYDGYGTFGGVDFHHAVGWLNGIADKNGDPEKENGFRMPGIDLHIAWADGNTERIRELIGDKTPIFPRFAAAHTQTPYDELCDPVQCRSQGYFYEDQPFDDDDDWLI